MPRPAYPVRPRNDIDDMEFHGEQALTHNLDPSMTLQEPADDADINVILKRMGVRDGSRLPYFPDANAIYGDISEMPTDPVVIAEIMRQAQLNFMLIPGDVRQKFANTEELYLYLRDPKNHKEAIELGLLQAPDPGPDFEVAKPADTKVSSSTSSDKEPTGATSNSNGEPK